MTYPKGNTSYSLRATIRGTREEVEEFKDHLDFAVSKSGKNETELIREWIMDGLTTFVQQCADGTNQCDPLTAKAINLRIEARSRAKRYREYDVVYDQLGQEKFIELCRESGIDEDEIQNYVTDRHWTNQALQWDVRMKGWLRQYLQDGNPYATSDIKTAAIRDGLIEDSETDWARVRKTAERMGLTNGPMKGYWQLPALSA
jgi:hypothetical protein